MGKRRHSPEGKDDRQLKQQKQEHGDDKKKDKEPIQSTGSSKLSVFRQLQIELTVSILPSGLKDVSRSVHESMHHFLLKYSTGMRGVPLAFNNIKLLKNGKGNILNELPHIHYSVACDATVFAPSEGQILTGVVRKSFHSHLSLVVFNYFNASISADALRANGYAFDLEDEQWKADDSTAAHVLVDDRISFRVLKVHESAGIISIEGANPSRLEAQ
jgi:DNA-directed RNA polymerase subunit E'/Rpb7